MKIFSPFLLLLLFPPVMLSQIQADSVVADTLDWHRYYPLAQGNLWEYQVSEGEPLLRREIVGDTLAGDQRYFLMEESSYDYDYIGGGTDLELWERDTLFVRYDSIGAVITLGEIKADTLAVPQNVPFDGQVYGYFDLRAAFGDSIYYGAGDEDYYWTRGGFSEKVDIGSETVEVLALKIFQSWAWMESYAADIGFLGGGNLWGPRITYAKVGGIEYGISRSPTAVEEETAVGGRFAIETIYPNPLSDRATVEYRLPKPQSITIEVFNVLGQRVGGKEESVHSAGVYSYHLKTSKWAGGTYLVRITTEEGQQSVQSVIVTR